MTGTSEPHLSGSRLTSRPVNTPEDETRWLCSHHAGQYGN